MKGILKNVGKIAGGMIASGLGVVLVSFGLSMVHDGGDALSSTSSEVEADNAAEVEVESND